MGIDIYILPSEVPFTSNLQIDVKDDVYHSVGMKFEINAILKFSQDTSSPAFDFLLLAHLVYCIDRVVARRKFSLDGWHRRLMIHDVPVMNLSIFEKAKGLLENAISFLTGDEWHFKFIQGTQMSYQFPLPSMYDIQEYSKVSLFSGGLDSLIGFIDQAAALGNGKKILLISHKELGKEGGDQKRILETCQQEGFYSNQYDQILLSAGIKSRSWVNPLPTENTFRARSLLFIAAGIYCAHAINHRMPLIIPENGTISLNIPLEKGRRGACSTRTTHPTFLKRIGEALRILGITNPLINPYQLQTKADMMVNAFKDSEKKKKLEALAHLSCSCAKRSHNRWWDKKGGIVRHCGYCLPCVYRRVSLDAVGMDSEDYIGTNIYRSKNFRMNDSTQARSSDIRSLLYFLKYNCNEAYIRRELLSNGVRDMQELNDYVELVLRSYCQVSNWLNKIQK